MIVTQAKLRACYKPPEEKCDVISFLDVLLMRTDGSIKTVYRKPTTQSQYTHFSSFALLHYQRNSQMFDPQVQMIRSDDSPGEELKHIHHLLRKHGYAQEFLMKNMSATKCKVQLAIVPTKPIILELQIKGYIVRKIVSSHSRNVLEPTFNRARLYPSFFSRPIVSLGNKDKLPR